MKSLTRKCLLTVAALAAAGTLNAHEVKEAIVVEAVFVRIEGMPTYLADRVEQEAQKGLRALNHYVQRTKTVHQLYLPDLLVTRQQAAADSKARGEKMRLVEIAKVD